MTVIVDRMDTIGLGTLTTAGKTPTA